jgi:hypothetical protein
MNSQKKVITYPHILCKMVTLFMEEQCYNHAIKVIVSIRLIVITRIPCILNDLVLFIFGNIHDFKKDFL